MLANASPELQDFLTTFFGEDNKFKLDKVLSESSDHAGKIRPWIEPLLEESPAPTVLPRWINKDVVWYAIAFNDHQYKRLAEELTAFIGPSYSTFHGRQARLIPSDPIDAAVYRLTGGTAYKFTGNNAKIWPALELMRRVWLRRPAMARESTRAMGRVLRDFYMALQAGNRTSAEEHLGYLQNHHFLDALNASFLRIQMLAELGLWGELLCLPTLPDLIKSRRPLEVTRAIIKAIYHRELVKFEKNKDYHGALSHFNNTVAPLYGGLFIARSGLNDPEAIKCLMLLAVSSSPKRLDLCNEILMSAGHLAETDREFLQQVVHLLTEQGTAPREGDPLELAAPLADQGDYGTAFDLATEAPPSIRRAKILVGCAIELQSLAARKEAVEAVQGLPQVEQDAFFRSRQNQRLWQALTEESDEQEGQANSGFMPDGWATWLSALNQSDFCDRALALARTGSVEWRVEDLLESPVTASQLEDLLQAQWNPRAEEVLHNALPHFLAFFQKDIQWPRRQFLNIYGILLDMLVMSTEGGDDDLTIFNELLQAFLTLGVDKGQYNEYIDFAKELWGRYASIAKLDWALDLADLLVIYPCPSSQTRLNFVVTVSGLIGKFLRRVSPGQWKFIQQLYEDLGQGEAYIALVNSYGLAQDEITREAIDIFEHLSRKTVALYTLTERVAKRVKETLEKRCSTVSVQISSDKVGSDRLRQMARSADIFVMATASAKHAATEFIEDHRPKELPILRPQGKGSASMLQAIYHFLQ